VNDDEATRVNVLKIIIVTILTIARNTGDAASRYLYKKLARTGPVERRTDTSLSSVPFF
jgi:hypothetical protein